MPGRFTMVAIGEALFDVIQGQRRLGGAPLNLAVQGDQLGRALGGRAVLVSRVGQDELGSQLFHELGELGFDTSYIQTDPDFATGRVFVRFGRGAGATGSPQYEIVPNAAWDMLWFDPDDQDLAMTADAVCFGSLAQRTGQGRNSIYRFLDASGHSLKMFDLNLRYELDGQPIYDRRILQRSCELANVVKLNEEELDVLVSRLGLSMPTADPQAEAQTGSETANAKELAIRELIERFELEMLVLTRGEAGTRLFQPTADPSAQTRGFDIFDGEPATYPHAEGADSVGAGDAAAAAILVGLTTHLRAQQIADLANHAGAYVASQPGATPRMPESIIQRLSPTP